MDQRNMRIALVSSSYHPHFGGVEEHVRHIAKELQDRGHAVEVWTVDRGDGLLDEVVDGCRVRYLPTPLPARSMRAVGSFALRVPLALARWARAHAEFRPDILNVQCFGPNGIYGAAIAQLTRTPLVISSHGETIMDEHSVYDRSTLLRVAFRRAIQASQGVTACSHFVADDLRSRFDASDVVVVPNGVHSGNAPPSVLAPLNKQDSPVLMAAGRLVRQKGFDILLRAAATSRHRPTVWIVGDGAERQPLESLANDLHIDDRVRFFGRRTAEEVQGLMSASDAVVVPSRVEPFGIVVLEAWASGTPVVATRHGGPASIITHQHDGILVDPEDLGSVVSAIDQLLNDRDLAHRLATAGSNQVKQYTWQNTARIYRQIYEDLIH